MCITDVTDLSFVVEIKTNEKLKKTPLTRQYHNPYRSERNESELVVHKFEITESTVLLV